MIFFDFVVGQDDVTRRLDRLLRKFLKTMPLSSVYKNIRNGYVKVNNKKVNKDYRVNVDDTINIEKHLYEKYCSLSHTDKEIAKADLISIDDIFINEHVRVINKQYGVNVQSSSKDDVSLDMIVKNDFIQKQSKGEHDNSLSFIPGPANRLDNKTTGLVMFSQSLVGSQYISEQISSHSIKKSYLCVLTGCLQSDSTWEHKIKKIDSKNNAFKTVEVVEGQNSQLAKSARTFVYPLTHGSYNGEQITLSRVVIETGRKHQIRSQASFSGHTLLGDTAYGYKGKSEAIYLHAHMLEFDKDNPIGLPQKLEAKLPISFALFIKKYLYDYSIPSYNTSI